jgi:molybdopterin-guanine dinucleotide biosynthesis protein A
MGRDKAFLTVGGRLLVGRVLDALEAAGAEDVHTIGGDVDRLARLGVHAHVDRHPGEGPLDGLVSALRVAQHDVVVVLACDLPNIEPALIERLRTRLSPPYEAVVPVSGNVPQPLAAAYARRVADVLDAAFVDGERSPRRALSRLRWLALEDVSPSSVVDLDDPADVARYASNDPSSEIDRQG